MQTRTVIKLKHGRMTVVGDSIKIGVIKLGLIADMTIGVHTVLDGIMDSITAERGKGGVTTIIKRVVLLE